MTPTRFHDERVTLPNGKVGPKTERIRKGSRVPNVSEELIVSKVGVLSKGRDAEKATYFTSDPINS